MMRCGYVIYPQRMYTHALRVNTRSAPHIRCAMGSCITYRRFSSSARHGGGREWRGSGAPVGIRARGGGTGNLLRGGHIRPVTSDDAAYILDILFHSNNMPQISCFISCFLYFGEKTTAADLSLNFLRTKFLLA
jgi:hypothetical protein